MWTTLPPCKCHRLALASAMTTINTARRAFFTGGAVSITHHVPWATEQFLELCQRCDDCIQSCEEGVLVRGDGGFPSVDFTRGACTFCGACAERCQHAALDRSRQNAWQLRAIIGDDCLSARGVMCRTCGEECDKGAIRFRLQPGGRATAVVDDDACNGCGGCVAVCPTRVIRIQEAA